MDKFAYNNAKNASINHMLFKLNFGYHFWVSYEENIDLCSKSKSKNKLSEKLKKLITVCKKNLYYTQELQKQIHNKEIKLKSYTTNVKIWLNNKYIKTKQNQKLEAKFFGMFGILHLISKETYKFELSNW